MVVVEVVMLNSTRGCASLQLIEPQGKEMEWMRKMYENSTALDGTGLDCHG